MCPNVTIGGDVDVDDRRFSPGVEINQILREELGSVKITLTPKMATWPIHTKRRSSVLKEPDDPVCRTVMFDVASGTGLVEGVELSRGIVTAPIEVVHESFVTSGGFPTLAVIARRQADERFVGACIDSEGEGMVRIQPVEDMFLQEATTKERTKFCPSQSAKFC